jgi:hypothetical protein
MGHQAENVSPGAADAGDVVEGAVRIGRERNRAAGGCVAENDAVFTMQLVESSLIAEVISLHVADRDGQNFSLRAGVGERRGCVFGSNVNRLADIFQAGIAQKRSGQEAGFAENLETVADSEDEPAAIGKAAHGFHDRREFCDCAGAQVIAESKPSGNDDGIGILQVMRFVPEESNRLFGYLLNGPERVVIAVGAGKDDDAEFHGMGLADFSLAWREFSDSEDGGAACCARCVISSYCGCAPAFVEVAVAGAMPTISFWFG